MVIRQRHVPDPVIAIAFQRRMSPLRDSDKIPAIRPHAVAEGQSHPIAAIVVAYDSVGFTTYPNPNDAIGQFCDPVRRVRRLKITLAARPEIETESIGTGRDSKLRRLPD